MSKNRNRPTPDLNPGQAEADLNTGQGQENAADTGDGAQTDASGAAEDQAGAANSSKMDRAPLDLGDLAPTAVQFRVAVTSHLSQFGSWEDLRDYLIAQIGRDDVTEEMLAEAIKSELSGVFDRVVARVRQTGAPQRRPAVPADAHPRRDAIAGALDINPAHIFDISADHSVVVTIDGRKIKVPA